MIEALAACASLNATKVAVSASLVSFSTWKDVIFVTVRYEVRGARPQAAGVERIINVFTAGV